MEILWKSYEFQGLSGSFRSSPAPGPPRPGRAALRAWTLRGAGSS